MTDRVKGLYVSLDDDYRVDDVQVIVEAIRMIRGVAAVSTEDTVTNMDDWMARSRVRMEVAKKLNDVVHDIINGKS